MMTSTAVASRALPALALLIAACGMPDSPQDAAHKAALEGGWFYEWMDDTGRTVTGTLQLARSGLFNGTESRPSEAASESSGEWFVTDGLFKLKTTRSDGRRLGSFQMGFFTCRLGPVDARGFACTDEIANLTYRFQRAAARS